MKRGAAQRAGAMALVLAVSVLAAACAGAPTRESPPTAAPAPVSPTASAPAPAGALATSVPGSVAAAQQTTAGAGATLPPQNAAAAQPNATAPQTNAAAQQTTSGAGATLPPQNAAAAQPNATAPQTNAAAQQTTSGAGATLPPQNAAAAQPDPAGTPQAAKSIVLEPRTDFEQYFKGSANAPVTFDMYGDFQCPSCGEFSRTIEPAFIQSYVDTGKVKYVWHDFTWIGDESISAAQAARCAGRQGQFWAYHDYLYQHQRGENEGQFSDANLQSFAAALGLDTDAFATCMDLQPDLPRIRQELRNGLGFRIQVTPSFLINGDLKIGAPPMSRLGPLLDSYVARGPVR